MIPIAQRKPHERPALALGAMNFGRRTPRDESERIVRRALERGITLFDTANSYNEGASESILGKALGKDRAKVVLTTKGGLGPNPGRREGLSPAALRSALDGSLGRLGVSSVDVYYLHVPDRTTPIEDSVGVMKELVDSGRVGSWGVCNYASWEILEMNAIADRMGLPKPVMTQLLYSPVHRQLDVEYFAFARRHPIHTSVYNVLAGGLLARYHERAAEPAKGSRFDRNAMYQRRFWTETMFDRATQVRAVAQAHGLSSVDFCYAWLATRPGIDSILVGPATVAQLDQAIDAVDLTLPAETLSAMDALALEWTGSDTNYVR
jgi:aryl-alcohol dehydrogenase-like predicted oxidoreductase